MGYIKFSPSSILIFHVTIFSLPYCVLVSICFVKDFSEKQRQILLEMDRLIESQIFPQYEIQMYL